MNVRTGQPYYLRLIGVYHTLVILISLLCNRKLMNLQYCDTVPSSVVPPLSCKLKSNQRKLYVNSFTYTNSITPLFSCLVNVCTHSLSLNILLYISMDTSRFDEIVYFFRIVSLSLRLLLICYRGTLIN